MVKSRHFDGLQPEWSLASAILGKKSNKKRRPVSTDEIAGFADLRPTDQLRIEQYIANYTGRPIPVVTTEKQAVMDQIGFLWKVTDIISKQKSLKPASLKAILEHNGVVSPNQSDFGRLLAETFVFGVPTPPGHQNNRCCQCQSQQPLTFSTHHGAYVCQAPQPWGPCPYRQSVHDTHCRAATLPPQFSTESWAQQIQTLCGSGFPPQKRLVIARATKIATTGSKPLLLTNSATAMKKMAAKAPKKLRQKPHLSRACVDPDSGLDMTHHVLDEAYSNKAVVPDPKETFPVELYDVSLCMTDISTGTNSEYKLQILVSDNKNNDKPRLWRVWGRVGGTGGGGSKLDTFDSIQECKHEFCKLFLKYSGNQWNNRKTFVKKGGKFLQMDVVYGQTMNDDNNSRQTISNNKKAAAVVLVGDSRSKLDMRVQHVIAAFFDNKAAAKQLESLKIDVTKLPLGNMTHRQLRSAYQVLTEIEALIKDTSMDATIKLGSLQQLSNQFYTKCPSTDPKLISTMELLKQQVLLVDELIQLQTSDSVMNGSGNQKSIAPIDEAYAKLKTELEPLDPTKEPFQMLKKYVENGRTAAVPGVQRWASNDWGRRGLRLLDAFEVTREDETKRFEPLKQSIGNRRLLWHGSRIGNYTGILSQGLRIAPPEAPASGYRFGKGVYFADLIGKSANYCQTQGSSEMYIMACDVALGKPFETHRDIFMVKAQPGTQSTHALSEITPDPTATITIPDNDGKSSVEVPLGTPVMATLSTKPSCDVSEFIVYDQAQVKIRYLLRLTTDPNTQAADGSTGGTPAATIKRSPQSNVTVVNRTNPVAVATNTRKNRHISGNAGGSDANKSTQPAKRSRLSITSFIQLDKEDKSLPSMSGLTVLDSRTFVEGLRLTVVKGDIATSQTQAIIVPSDESLSLAGMVAERIQKVAGPSFVAEVKAKRGNNNSQQQASATVFPDNLKRIDANVHGLTIRELATNANIPYLTPYYKMIKKEDVSATKDVICVGKNGAFHRGQDARSFLKMGKGKKVSISPALIPPDCEVFIQSSSHTRKIPIHSSILLEISATKTTVLPPVASATPGIQHTVTNCCLVVGGHNLPSKHVIFVVSPVFSRQAAMAAEKSLKATVKNVLLECAKLGLTTVTLPSIGSGRAGYDKGQAAGWIIATIVEYLKGAGGNGKQSLVEVCFCLYDDSSLKAYQEGIAAHDAKGT